MELCVCVMCTLDMLKKVTERRKIQKSVFEHFCPDRIVKWKGYKSLQWDWAHARFHLQVGPERNR